jgi:Ion channel
VRHHDVSISVAGVAALSPGDSAPVEPREIRQPQFRYPAVLALTFVATVFLIAAPTADWSRALTVAIEGGALVLTVATSRERASVRRRWSVALGAGMIAIVILIALGIAPKWLIASVAIIITAGVPVALVRGLLRLLRTEGVTFNAVAGSLAISLSVGLLFAWIIGFITEVSNTPYFTEHGAVTEGDKVYFSFTALTTTGFGDFTPATSVGHALAVIEMLTGQLYLVTVIGLLIGNFAGRRRAA